MGDISLSLEEKGENTEITLEELKRDGWEEVGSFAGSKIILGFDNARCLYDRASKKVGIIFTSPPAGIKN
jgi:hypothetical protein